MVQLIAPKGEYDADKDKYPNFSDALIAYIEGKYSIVEEWNKKVKDNGW